MEKSEGAEKKSDLINRQDTPPSCERKKPPVAIVNTVFGVALKTILLIAPPVGPMALNEFTPALASIDALSRTAANAASALPSMVSLSPFIAAAPGELRYVQPYECAVLQEIRCSSRVPFIADVSTRRNAAASSEPTLQVACPGAAVHSARRDTRELLVMMRWTRSLIWM